MKIKIIVCAVLLIYVTSVFAQEAGVQELEGSVSPDEPEIQFLLPDMSAGDMVYLYAESDDFDTFLYICDEECEETLADNDDISEDNVNSALEFEIPADGDYYFGVGDCCDNQVEGDFRLLVSLDDVSVLTGEAEPTGAEIAEDISKLSDAMLACLPDERDAQAVFDIFELTDEEIDEVLEANDWGSVENLQELIDNSEVLWTPFIHYLVDDYDVDLESCSGSGSSSGGGASTGACLPVERNVQAVFDAFDLNAEDIAGILESNNWGSVEELQQIVDDGALNWGNFIEYLEGTFDLNLPNCETSTSACLPVEHDVQAVFDAFELNDNQIENILEINNWGSVEELQQIEDDGDLLWDDFIDYLEGYYNLDLPMCN